MLGAGRGYLWLSPLLVACLVCVNIRLSADPSSTIRIVLTVGVFGSLLDSALGAVGLLHDEDEVGPVEEFWSDG